jgi:hypothetical protein
MIIVLRGADDDAPHIVHQLRADGLPIVIKHKDELAFRKSLWMNKVARDVLKAKRADFLFMLDADEFIKPPSRAFLDQMIDSITSGATAALRWECYAPTPDDATNEPNILKRIQHRCMNESQRICKVNVSPHFCEDHMLLIADGHHAMLRGLGTTQTPLKQVVLRGLSLAHFPVPFAAQLPCKAMIGTWSRGCRMVVPTKKCVSAITGCIFIWI